MDVLMDWLFGERCEDCGFRIFPKDKADHDEHEHGTDATVPRQQVV